MEDVHGQLDETAIIDSFIVLNQDNIKIEGTITAEDNVFSFVPTAGSLPQGTYIVSLMAKDAWGNTKEYTFTFTVDSDAPMPATITGGTVSSGLIQVRPEPNRSDISQIELTGTREDQTRVLINGIEKSSVGSGDWSAPIVLVQGENTLQIIIEDRAGNQSTPVFVDILFDSVAPVVTGTLPLDNSFTNVPPDTIEVQYSEQMGTLDINAGILSVKDKNLAIVAGEWTDHDNNRLVFTPQTPFVESIYQIEVLLVDDLGNQGTAKMFHFTLDMTPPPKPVIDPVTSPTHKGSQIIHGDREAFAAIWMNGEMVVDHEGQTRFEHGVTLTAGLNEFSFSALDRAGNESQTTLVAIFFDDTPPLAVETLTINPDGNGTSILLNWDGYDETFHGDIASYRVYVQDTFFTTITGLTPFSTVNAGTFTAKVNNLTRNTTYYFAVVAVDHAGNALESVSAVKVVPNDIDPPKNPGKIHADCFKDTLVFHWQPAADTDGDLAGYKVYFNNDTSGISIPVDENQFEQTGLNPSTAYEFKVTSLDNDGNESPGNTFTGITLLDNPKSLVVNSFSGYVKLSWDAVLGAEYVKHYNVYVSDSPFTSVESMTARRSTTSLSASITGLINDQPYYFAVTAVNLCDGEQNQVDTVAATPVNDTTGPILATALFEGTPLIDGLNLTSSGKVNVSIQDPAGGSAVEFYFNDTLIRKDYSEPYSAYIDIFNIPDDTYTLKLICFDTLGNRSEYEYTLTTGLIAPDAPVILHPENNWLTNKTQITIQGTTDKFTDVTLILNGEPSQAMASVGPLGLFSILITVNNGDNRIWAIAENRSGQSPVSNSILITVDTSIPDCPRALSGQSRPGGEIKLLWQKPLNKVVAGFNIYRSNAEFTSKTQGQKLNTKLIASTGYTDLPDQEGTWFYGATAVDSAGNESALSNVVSVLSDHIPPRAVRIEYTSQGKTDLANNRYAPGRVDLRLYVSEPLGAMPFLTITPEGASLNPLSLKKLQICLIPVFLPSLPPCRTGRRMLCFLQEILQATGEP